MANAQGRAVGLLARLQSSLNFSFRASGAAVGLSIGASTVKVAQLKKKKNSWVLEKYASVNLAAPMGEQREITHSESVADAISEVMRTAGIQQKKVCSAVVGSGLIIKNLNLIVSDMKELQDQVFWEAEQYIPFDISEVVIDFQIINKTKDQQVEVILVAVKKKFLEQYMGVIEEAKLEASVVDAEVFALQNAFESNYETNSTTSMLLADVGAVSTKIVICSGGNPYFTKDAAFGGSLITQEIQRELNLSSPRDAETLKVSPNLPHEVHEVIARMGHVFGTELKKAVDFYTASSLGPPIVGILLSGGGARSAELLKIVEDYTGLPTQFLNPFQKISSGSKNLPEEYLMSIGPEATIPVGLAIRAGEAL